MVDVVVLPSHAQTTTTSGTATATTAADPCAVVPTGSQQFMVSGSFLVPACVTQIKVTALGAAGGAGSDRSSPVAAAGLGGQTIDTLRVTPEKY